jgi:hypothetical protein
MKLLFACFVAVLVT